MGSSQGGSTMKNKDTEIKKLIYFSKFCYKWFPENTSWEEIKNFENKLATGKKIKGKKTRKEKIQKAIILERYNFYKKYGKGKKEEA